MTAAAPGRALDVVTMGRAAVDFYGEQVGCRLEDMTSFAKYLGGCAANIAVGASRLGLKAALISRVGDEHMGRFVRETLVAEGVDVSHVRTDPERLTGLVVLGIRDRDTFPLIFFRENCADMALTPDDADPGFIASARALVVTGTHFSAPGVDAASRAAMARARAAGTRVVLDIDYRPVLWKLTGHGWGERRFVASDDVTRHLQSIVPDCDVVVGTEEEIHIAGGATDTLAALRALRARTSATLVVKRGPLGCAVFEGAIPARIADGLDVPGFPVEVFNVLGAGDSFMAGLLRGWLDGNGWAEAGRIANACGALVVSRHGCAPAMPSAAELAVFLARRDLPFRLREDKALAHVHRATTGRRAWPEVLALAFDHRRQLEELVQSHGAPLARIAAFKRLVAEAARPVIAAVPGGGVILDERYGADALAALTGSGAWIARPIEVPGAVPLAFEGGPDPAVALREWPAEHVVKCLISAHPGDAPALSAAQEAELARLQRACVATGHELLLEIVPRGGPPDDADVLAALVERFAACGMRPEWWKLPPLADPVAWRRVGDAVRRGDPYCRGILVLGLDAPEATLAGAFAAAAAEPLVRGFAVGRSIFWSAARAWFAGDLDDDGAIAHVRAGYEHVIALWRARRAAL